MKYRNGFVSNSSSSSFIFALPNRYKGKIKLTVDIDLTEFGKICKTKAALDKYYLEYYDCKTIQEIFEEDSGFEKQYNKCLQQLDKGRVIVVGTVSNENEPGAEYILCEGDWTIKDPQVIKIGEISF